MISKSGIFRLFGNQYEGKATSLLVVTDNGDQHTLQLDPLMLEGQLCPPQVLDDGNASGDLGEESDTLIQDNRIPSHPEPVIDPDLPVARVSRQFL